jgi:hypothetical protein
MKLVALSIADDLSLAVALCSVVQMTEADELAKVLVGAFKGDTLRRLVEVCVYCFVALSLLPTLSRRPCPRIQSLAHPELPCLYTHALPLPLTAPGCDPL